MAAAIALIIGLVIVGLAVGIPFWFTHKRMRDHHDVTESQAYLDATGKTPADAADGRPGQQFMRHGTRDDQAAALHAAAKRNERTPSAEH